MPPQDPTGDTPPHRATAADRGSFAIARCTCGWIGPARRSRERARSDAELHTATPAAPATER
ncbi:hypothetical protein ABT010_36825 [Streptomyces sp. NPDC002668]|uniref:hypothetical protein n=1 Tax=Streptomyces sp. NPDC002668 TaxID=3154422 RepID=UPI003320CE8A